jgi:hypothetical protein
MDHRIIQGSKNKQDTGDDDDIKPVAEEENDKS